MQSLNVHQFVSKLIPNSPILSNYHELRSIVVNKGQIHREIGNFEIAFEIRSNRMIKCGEKLGKFIDLERELIE